MITSNSYITGGICTTSTATCTGGYIYDNGGIIYDIPTGYITVDLNQTGKGQISPQLFFSYVKKRFGILERRVLDKRLEKIEKAFDTAVENGQNVLAEKILKNLVIETRESFLYAKGITKYIEKDVLYKYKHRIKGGHISDTMLKDYTRVIPKRVTAKIEKVKEVFDDFVIFHYYEREVEQKLEKKQKMTKEEKEKMRDPIVFGIIKETDKLYFVADWDDEYCDLTFDKIVDVIGNQKINNNPNL